MVKHCSVSNCKSGREADRNERKKKNIRQVSIFKVPKCPIRRKKWMDALQQALSEKDAVCELHFQEDDIKKSESFMIDGNITTISNIRWTLRPEAVPMSSASIMECEQVLEVEERNIQQIHDIPPEMEHSQIETEVSECPTQNMMSYCNEQQMTERVVIQNEPLHDIVTHFGAIMPEGWLYYRKSSDIVLVFFDINNLAPKIQMRCTSARIIWISYQQRKEINTGVTITSVDDLHEIMTQATSLPLCHGTEIENRYASHCSGVIIESEFQRSRRFQRCKSCSELRRRLLRLEKSRQNVVKKLNEKKQYLIARKNRRLSTKITQLKMKIDIFQRRCAQLADESFNNQIKVLNSAQQLAVRACLDAARRKNAKGRRYQLEWIYECLLIRMKRGGLYNFIRKREILPLPHINTLNKYIQKIASSAYGFQPALFDCLKLRASEMRSFERRGVLLVDEMKLSQSISFNKQTMQFCGFVNSGNYTPNHQKNSPGDHALVFMFVPFCGRWVQSIACFISKNMAPSTVLHKLIIECIILLENANIYVDAVTSDGAQTNRGVWNILGITEECMSIEHPCDESPKVFFISDFSHLIKCLRNNIVQYSSFNTPYGIVKKSHWLSVLELEHYPKHNLRIAYKLTPAHLNPVGYQKMNVLLAFQLFSTTIANAMEILEKTSERLQDSLSTQRFIRLINDLIVAMTSRTPATALRYEDPCRHKMVIQDFLFFLEMWQAAASADNEVMPISSSTLTGLKVTLKGTLQLLEYLHVKENYSYLMTSRLSQDPIERFFSIMRGACGSNDHPDPTLFGQVFRLMTCFSLVRPPKGCNVPGPELLKTLMETKQSLSLAEEPRKNWLEKIDGLLENGTLMEVTNTEEILNNESSVNRFTDHTYTITNTSDEVQAYVAGYIIRRMKRSVRCRDCLTTLIATDEDKQNLHNQYELIRLTNLHDGLHYPSINLFLLTRELEKCILHIVNSYGVEIDTMQRIINEIETLELPRIGCEQHQHEVTFEVIDLYLVMRGHFLSKSENQKNIDNHEKTKMHRKTAKLY